MEEGKHPMIGASKILTVSYGTFSCTLEGFDDPFNTMRAIAEYFRDLAAEDRYFGAEPPTPDAAMLHKIAEREVQRRVEAKIQDNGVILRTGEAMEAPAPAPVPSQPAARIEAPEAPQPAPAQPHVAAPIPTPMPDGVAAKLMRIRAAVANAELAETTTARAAEPSAAPSHLPILTDYSEDQHADDFALPDTFADTFEKTSPQIGFDAEPDVQDAWAAPENTPAELETAELETPEPEFAEPELAEPELAEPVLADAIPDAPDLTEPELAEIGLSEINLADADLANAVPQDAPTDASLGTSDADFDAEIDDAEDFDMSSLQDRFAEIDAADHAVAEIQTAATTDNDLAALIDGVAGEDALHASDDTVQDGSDTDYRVSEDDLADLKSMDGALTDTSLAGLDDDQDALTYEDLAAAEDDTADFADPELDAEFDDEPVSAVITEDGPADPILAEIDQAYAPEVTPASGPSEKVLRARARVIKVRRTDAEGEVSAADIRNVLGSQLDEESEDLLRRKLQSLQNDAETPVQNDTADETGAEDDARRRLDPAGEAAVARLIEQTNEVMAVPENRRRLSAIAHLKAAVAATVADRFAKGGSTQQEPETARLDPYREDLARVVRPQTPAEGEDVAPTQRPAPLVLVSAQRIDRDRVKPAENGPVLTTVSNEPIRPRRVTSAQLVAKAAPVLEEDEEDEIEGANMFSDARGFAEFSDRLGANSLAEILEAAAAYSFCIEGRPYFSRPQLMGQIGALSADSDFSREDGLRTFGALLRQGRIRKIKRGQFVLAENSHYLAEARKIAG